MSPSPGKFRRATYAVYLAVLLGAGAGAAGMLLYPGGTFFDPAASGYDFWLNFLCDATHEVSLNGKPNGPGALCTQISLIALTLGLLPIWVLAPTIFPAQMRLGKLVQLAGSVATLALLAIPLTPSDRFGVLHGVAVSLAGPLGLLAAIGMLLGLHSRGRQVRVITGLTALVVALCLVDLGLYLYVTWGRAPLTPALPIVQKLALLLALLWMLACARHIARLAPASQSPEAMSRRSSSGCS